MDENTLGERTPMKLYFSRNYNPRLAVAAWHARLKEIPAWRDPFEGLVAPELPPVKTTSA